jgi:hypothetical protein
MKNWKADLVGQTRKNTPEEFELIKNRELNKPLTWEAGVCRCVCLKCQDISEINKEFALGLLETMKIMGNFPEIPLVNLSDLKKWYFEISYCDLCSPGEVLIKIKPIKKGVE